MFSEKRAEQEFCPFFGLKIQMWLFCWFLNSMILNNTMKIMLNDVQKSYKMTVICTSKEAWALKKSEIKERFFLLSLRHCCWFPFCCCRCNISRWFSALDFFWPFVGCQCQSTKLSSSTFDDEGKFLGNDWELNQRKMIHWVFFFVCAIDSSKPVVWRQLNINDFQKYEKVRTEKV